MHLLLASGNYAENAQAPGLVCKALQHLLLKSSRSAHTCALLVHKCGSPRGRQAGGDRPQPVIMCVLSVIKEAEGALAR